MKQKSRTEYSVMNTTVAFLAQTLAIFMGFFTRVVFTRTLSEGYVGINGLFTDILNILSLSELGVGTAITYALYAPIARRDIKKQQILMRMFRNFYRITAGFVVLAGLCLIPFLDILMKDRPDVNHLIIIYLLYLLNSVPISPSLRICIMKSWQSCGLYCVRASIESGRPRYFLQHSRMISYRWLMRDSLHHS